jgi:hypothetical protein
MNHKWKQLILVVNFLFGFSVNKIQKRYFYWILTSPSFAVCEWYEINKLGQFLPVGYNIEQE